MTRYESIRQGVLEFTPGIDGVAAIRYHGMLAGLATLGPTAPDAFLAQEATNWKPLPAVHAASDEFVHTLANLVLLAQPEHHHVY